jgi:hypothetical protein
MHGAYSVKFSFLRGHLTNVQQKWVEHSGHAIWKVIVAAGCDSDPYTVPAASILLTGGPLIWLLWLGSPSMASPIQLVPFSDNSLLTVQSRYIQ